MPTYVSATLYVAAYTLGSNAAAMAKERMLSNRWADDQEEDTSRRLSLCSRPHPHPEHQSPLILTSIRAAYAGAIQNFKTPWDEQL